MIAPQMARSGNLYDRHRYDELQRLSPEHHLDGSGHSSMGLGWGYHKGLAARRGRRDTSVSLPVRSDLSDS